MKALLSFTILLIALSVTGQSLSESQQKAINNYIQLANHLTSQVSSIGPSLVRVYNESTQITNTSTRPVWPYTCKLAVSSYYFDDAKQTSTALGAIGSGLAAKSAALQQVYQKIDEACKALEIYYRLKDYEADKFEKLRMLIDALQQQVALYHIRVSEFQTEVDRVVAILQPYQAGSAYHKASKLMREQLVFERELIQAWKFNVAQNIHTGWPNEKAQQHVLDNLKRIEVLNQTKPALQYPASSQYSSFVENIESLQQTKRLGVNEYTYEEQQSDAYSNRVYENLINYYNNAAISFYNNFINMARQNGYRGVYYLTYPLQFDIRTEVKIITIEVTPFTEKTIQPFSVTPVATAIPPAVFSTLTNYVDFINEGVRQINNMRNSMGSVNGDASRGKAYMAEGRRVLINYHYKNFQLPITLYQQTINQTKVLPTPYQKPLTEQAEVLYSILNELNQWNNVLLADAATKRLDQDSLNHVYKIVRRYKVLADVFEERKEILFTDVRKIFESYKITNPSSAWVISGRGLRALLDEDYKELVKVKRFLLGDSSATLIPDRIEKTSRELITNEYTNMAGIQKLGRYNGLCPYSPYEDLPKHSLEFIDFIKQYTKGKSYYGRHPYNEILYSYNQILVRDYNQFASLSKVPLLKSVNQVEYFVVMEPEKPARPKAVTPSVVQTTPTVYIAEPDVEQKVVDTKKLATVPKQKREKNSKRSVEKSSPEISGGVIHDTVRITDIIRIETIRQDTVYISKVDTVYVGMQGDNLSMEGYATNNMVLLLDVSGSMNAPEKLPLLKKSVLLLMKMMREEDQVSIITYSGKAKVELQPTSFKEEERITRVIERLKSEGNTDGIAGIKLAYQVADKNYKRGGNNRIILATDGEFPISRDVYELVEKFASEDIFITVFNFGKNTVATKNLQQLVTKGRGNYEYITRENVDAKLVREAKAKKRK